MSRFGSLGGLHQSVGYQVFIFVLSIYAVAALLLDLVFHFPPEVSNIVQHFDVVVCGVFFADFVVQLVRAESKLQYLKVGWIDLLASIPSADFLRWGRVARILRILRVLRAIRGTHRIYRLLFATPGSTMGSGAVAALLVVIFSSISILLAETTPTSNIKTAEDAIWWSFTTISTVGYGDRYPVTTEGRAIAVVLMIVGIGLLGSVTGFVASYFTGNQKRDEESDPLRLEIARLHGKIDALHETINRINGVRAPSGEQHSTYLSKTGAAP
jgi:voltage-gated potassium channel